MAARRRLVRRLAGERQIARRLEDLRSAIARRDPDAAYAAQLALLDTLERSQRRYDGIVGEERERDE